MRGRDSTRRCGMPLPGGVAPSAGCRTAGPAARKFELGRRAGPLGRRTERQCSHAVLGVAPRSASLLSSRNAQSSRETRCATCDKPETWCHGAEAREWHECCDASRRVPGSGLRVDSTPNQRKRRTSWRAAKVALRPQDAGVGTKGIDLCEKDIESRPCVAIIAGGSSAGASQLPCPDVSAVARRSARRRRS